MWQRTAAGRSAAGTCAVASAASAASDGMRWTIAQAAMVAAKPSPRTAKVSEAPVEPLPTT